MARSKKSGVRARGAKVVKKTLRRLSRRLTVLGKPAAQIGNVSLEDAEKADQAARIQRLEDTRKRNTAAQNWPDRLKKARKEPEVEQRNRDQDADTQAFFECIDNPLVRICGSCGELSKSARMVKKRYIPRETYFDPLKNADGVCEAIAEAITQPDSGGMCFIWICNRCHTSLTKKEIPKFCRASGFRISPVPVELAALNRTEARLVGLGVCFTTCMNLYKDQQEFTRGNAVNYWNDVHEVTLSLPRPLSKCGVILLRSSTSRGETFIKVRPDVVRTALQWLIVHNPLYKNVTISEKNLAEIASSNPDTALTSIELTQQEENELRTTRDDMPRGLDTRDQQGRPSQGVTHKEDDPPIISQNDNLNDHNREKNGTEECFDVEESIELQADQSDTQTEAEKIILAANVAAGKTLYPVGELKRWEDPGIGK